MNLIEALKSGRRIRNLKLQQHTEWFGPSGEFFVYDSIISATWEVEPEKVEPIVFECRWKRDIGADPVIYPVGEGNFAQLLGKRTRVTVEVLGEE